MRIIVFIYRCQMGHGMVYYFFDLDIIIVEFVYLILRLFNFLVVFVQCDFIYNVFNFVLAFTHSTVKCNMNFHC